MRRNIPAPHRPRAGGADDSRRGNHAFHRHKAGGNEWEVPRALVQNHGSTETSSVVAKSEARVPSNTIHLFQIRQAQGDKFTPPESRGRSLPAVVGALRATLADLPFPSRGSGERTVASLEFRHSTIALRRRRGAPWLAGP